MFSTSAKPHPNPHGNPQSIKHSLKLSQKNPTWSCNKIKENLSFHNSLAFFYCTKYHNIATFRKKIGHTIKKKKIEKKIVKFFK
jgi:hypothetical protein